MIFHVYILYSSDKDKYYVGQTEHLEQRISEHRIRKNLGARDWTLKYSEEFKLRGDAMKREVEIKAKKSRKYIESLIRGKSVKFN